MASHWSESFHTYIWVLNTGRGLSVCIRFPHNIGLMYDLGASDGFSPATFVERNIAPKLTKYKGAAIAQTVISHPHADHILEVDAIAAGKPLCPALITCPNDHDPESGVSQEKVDFRRLQNAENASLLDAYRDSYSKRHPPLQTLQATNGTNPLYSHIPTDVEYGLYYLRPPLVAAIHPSNDQDYGNGLSLVLYLRYGQQSILITGDITPEIFRLVLTGKAGIERRYTYFRPRNGVPDDFYCRTSSQPTLQDLLQQYGLTVLLPPHHGLESCYCPELFQMIRNRKTSINVISEKRQGPTEGSVDCRYQSQDTSFGSRIDIDGQEQNCYSATTRNGHHILLVLEGTKPKPRVYLRKDPYDLLKIV